MRCTSHTRRCRSRGAVRHHGDGAGHSRNRRKPSRAHRSGRVAACGANGRIRWSFETRSCLRALYLHLRAREPADRGAVHSAQDAAPRSVATTPPGRPLVRYRRGVGDRERPRAAHPGVERRGLLHPQPGVLDEDGLVCRRRPDLDRADRGVSPWNGRLAADGSIALGDAEYARIRGLVLLQVGVFLFIPLCAAFMARGL